MRTRILSLVFVPLACAMAQREGFKPSDAVTENVEIIPSPETLKIMQEMTANAEQRDRQDRLEHACYADDTDFKAALKGGHAINHERLLLTLKQCADDALKKKRPDLLSDMMTETASLFSRAPEPTPEDQAFAVAFKEFFINYCLILSTEATLPAHYVSPVFRAKIEKPGQDDRIDALLFSLLDLFERKDPEGAILSELNFIRQADGIQSPTAKTLWSRIAFSSLPKLAAEDVPGTREVMRRINELSRFEKDAETAASLKSQIANMQQNFSSAHPDYTITQ